MKLRVRGRDEEGVAEACEGSVAKEGLIAILRAVPAYRRHWDVRLSPGGSPRNPEDLARVVWGNIPVRIMISRG